MSSYEPTSSEIRITLLLGGLAGPFYRSYANSLPLRGDERVLDFGAGSGVCSRFLAQRLLRGGGSLACVDVSQRWQAVIRKTLQGYPNVEYRCSEIDEVDYPAGSFDAAFVHFVLHDIPEDEVPCILGALWRLLKPGGALYLREPANPGHGAAPGALLGMLEQNGFETLSIRRETSWFAGEMSVGVFRKT